MAKIGFLTDSGSDIEQFPELQKMLGVDIIYLYINIGDEVYTDENLSLDQLLEKMNEAGKDNWPKTSQPSAGDFLEKYEQLKADGITDLISVHVASKLSGTVNSARLAAEQIEDFNVYIIDSQMASMGLIPIIMKTKELINAGKDPKQIMEQMNAYALESEIFACVPRLDNLYKGGRLKPIRYRLGKLLKFKPVLRVFQGEILSYDKTRKLEATQEMGYVEALKDYTPEDDFEFLISHAWAPESAETFKQRFMEEYPGKSVHIGRVGPSMAVHLGPEGLVFAVYRK